MIICGISTIEMMLYRDDSIVELILERIDVVLEMML